MNFTFKTKAEQKLEWLEGVGRPLTIEESEDLRRSMHAVYERERRARHLAQHRNEELRLLKKMEREARMKSDLG
jgi:hypothetical protein